MKNLLFIILSIVMVFSFTGCSEESEKDSGGSSSSSQDFGDGNDNDGSDNGGTDNGGGSTSTGGNCAGTTADGTGTGTSIHQFNLFLAGHQSWVPGSYDFNDSLISQTQINLQEASLLFASDTRLQLRFKVNTQPFPTAGEVYCYGRETGMASDQYNYTKLRFRVHLRDILCDTPDPLNPSQCQSGFYLGPRYRSQFIEPTNVDSCTNIIDIGALRNSSAYGTTVEVEDVKSDSTCQANDTFCPAEKIVRRASCWHLTMQVVTDYTQSFKN